MQDNIFEWHFAVRGPPDTEFEVCFPDHLLRMLVQKCPAWNETSFGVFANY